MAGNECIYNSNPLWKDSYVSQVKNELYLSTFRDIVYSDHFKKRVWERKIRIPTIKTLLYGKVSGVCIKDGRVKRAVIDVKGGEYLNRKFVLEFEDKKLIFITTFLDYRKGE